MAQKITSPINTLHTLSAGELRGIDLQNNPAAVSVNRSPDCRNMLRSTPGRVCKRPGYRQIAAYSGCVHGCYELAGTQILHVGDVLYAGGVAIGSAADAHSCGKYFGGRLYLLDGSSYQCIYQDGQGDWHAEPVSQHALCPHITISKDPDGSGGAELQDVNLLSDSWTESFYSDGVSTVYQLEFGDLDETAVQVRVLVAGEDGPEEQTLEENTDFSVDRTTGQVIFVTAPGDSPVEGEDNVFITASKDRSTLRERIETCDVCFAYGGPARGMRLFLTGNGTWKNRDYWSACNDPTYFSDLDYSVLGQDDQRILGYSLLGDSLAAHKTGEGGVWVRTGEEKEFTDAQGNTRSRFVFSAGRVISGYGAVARDSFATLGDEPLFLTAQGVFALTASELTGTRYQQRRSFYIDPALCAEAAPQQAQAVIWKDFYLLALGDKLYCLDGLQKSYAAGAPKSDYQYECYLLDNIPAVRLWVQGGQLYFGTQDGRICVFDSGEAVTEYTDRLTGEDPQAIRAYWDTPELVGTAFYRDKWLRRLSVQMDSATATSLLPYLQREGVWHALRQTPLHFRFFSFSDLQFSHLSFLGDQTGRTVGLRLPRSRVDKVRFRMENAEKNEPFGLLGWAMEYTEGGRHRHG